MSDIDTAVADSLKLLDPKRPIREADIGWALCLDALVANDPTATLGGVAVLLAPAAPGLVFNRKGQFRRVT